MISLSIYQIIITSFEINLFIIFFKLLFFHILFSQTEVQLAELVEVIKRALDSWGRYYRTLFSLSLLWLQNNL